ncbi:ABC transporter permease [Phytohabitans houttuyneae]|uniref:ABC transporter permease n=1 Tax=Phytohabitans houttuyneae TaxID=1076126 RepID=A0A6V8KIP7_9ACTN|nr:ABC transporter permease subunit [Phytohabitans houttuyneae]GFJ82298.1 ABC transporter permease [Phytohabitans houttuyneae]
MLSLIGNEWTKLRTVRGPWLLIAIQQAVIVAGVSGLAAAGTDLDTDDGVRTLMSHAGLVSAIFTLVLGVTAVAGEYRHRTVTDTYLATPHRARVVAAKLAVYTLLGTAAGVLSAAVGTAVAALWLAADGSPLDLQSGMVWRIAAGIVAFNLVYAAIGVALGALVRNLTAAVTAALVWIALVETIVGNLLGDLGRWLPNRAGLALGYMPSTVPVLPQWGAGLVLVGYAVVIVVAASATTVRRDVT